MMTTPVAVDKLDLIVQHGRNRYNITLALKDCEAGDAVSLHHLCTKMESITGVPACAQAYVVNGDVEAAVRKEMYRNKPSTPLHLVGIKNDTKLHMYGEQSEPWNDEGWLKLERLEQQYNQLKVNMDRVLHSINILRSDKSVSEENRLSSFSKLAEQLVLLLKKMDKVKEHLDKVSVSAANKSRSEQMKSRLRSNMAKRSEEVEAVLYALKQNEFVTNTKLLLLRNM